MKHNLVHRGLAEYKAGILYILGRIMGRGKGYTNKGGATVTTLGSEDYIKQKLVARLPRSQPGKRGESLTEFQLHPPPLGPLDPIIYPPLVRGTTQGGICCQGPRLTSLNAITQGR